MKINEEIVNVNSSFKDLISLIGKVDGRTKIIPFLFLKTLVDDVERYENASINDKEKLNNFKEKFLDDKLKEKDLYDVFKIVCKLNNLKDNIICDVITANKYSEYFNGNIQKKINAILKEMDFPLNYDIRKKYIISILNNFALDGGTYAYSSISSQSIINIGNTILDIGKEDSVLNPFGGLGMLLLEQKEYKTFDLYDVDPILCAYTYMIKIMCRIEKFNIEQKNFYGSFAEKRYKKIFSDGVVNLKITDGLENTQYIDINDSDILNIRKTCDFLEFNGRGIVVSPNKVLYAMNNQYINLRNDLVSMGLKAIIMLPNGNMYGTFIPINLLVFEKGYHGQIILINMEDSKYYDIGRRNLKIINKEGMDVIKDIFFNNKDIEGVSKRVDYIQIYNEQSKIINLKTPFEKKEKKEYRDLNAIDQEILELLKKMNNL